MNIEYYTKAEDLPLEMRDELREAAHAGEAEKVFNKWVDRFYVERRERAKVWVEV